MSKPRPLQPQELALVKFMISAGSRDELLSALPESLVEEMQDGNMGSLRFVTPEDPDRRYGSKIVEAEFTDADGVLVSVALNLDDRGNLFELDLWKVDFSPLERYPKPEDLRFGVNSASGKR